MRLKLPRGLFQMGTVEHAGQLPKKAEEDLVAIQAKVARGKTLSPESRLRRGRSRLGTDEGHAAEAALDADSPESYAAVAAAQPRA